MTLKMDDRVEQVKPHTRRQGTVVRVAENFEMYFVKWDKTDKRDSWMREDEIRKVPDQLQLI